MAWLPLALKQLQTRIGWRIACIFVLLCFSYNQAIADSFAERRAQVGLKLFKTLVTADLKLIDKIDSKQTLPVIVLYSNNQANATKYKDQLQALFAPIDTVPFNVEVGTLDKLHEQVKTPYVAVFISQPLSDTEIDAIVKYGINHSVIVFSPFEGDVERGVLGGLSVQAAVRPLLNMHTLQQSRLTIKPFYLKVAKKYE